MKYRIREVRSADYTVYHAEYKDWVVSFSWQYVDMWGPLCLTMEAALKEIDQHKEKIRKRKKVVIIHKVEV